MTGWLPGDKNDSWQIINLEPSKARCVVLKGEAEEQHAAWTNFWADLYINVVPGK